MEELKRLIDNGIPLQVMFNDGLVIYVAEPFLVGDTLYFRDNNISDSGAAVNHKIKIESVDGLEWFFNGGSVLEIIEMDPLYESVAAWEKYKKEKEMTRDMIWESIVAYFPELN